VTHRIQSNAIDIDIDPVHALDRSIDRSIDRSGPRTRARASTARGDHVTTMTTKSSTTTSVDDDIHDGKKRLNGLLF